MGLFSPRTLEHLDDLLHGYLKDLYDAEKQLVKALPRMAEASTDAELKAVFRNHLDQTEYHATRLEKAFRLLGHRTERETCDAMKGLIAECDEILDAQGDPSVKDAALIGAAQRVEHYEIAGYGTVRTLARQLGHTQVANLLQATLDEEGEADKRLTVIAEERVNVDALGV